MRGHAFDPGWVLPPGEILQDHLDEVGSSVTQLVAATELPFAVLVGILEGTESLTEGIADDLERATGVSAQVWLNLEEMYREGLAAGKQVL